MRRLFGHVVRHAPIFVLAAALWPAATLAEEGFEEPAFALPVIAGDGHDGVGCGTPALSVFRSRGDSVLSVVRPAPGRWVGVGVRGGPPAETAQVTARCVIDVVLQRPLDEPRSLGLDFRGGEAKEPGATLRLTIELGAQRHVFEHAAGQLLEDRGPQLKRFWIELPAGARSLRIAVSGEAAGGGENSGNSGNGAAHLGFDSLDLCFIDAEEPEFCGAAGYPNPRAAGS